MLVLAVGLLLSVAMLGNLQSVARMPLRCY